MPDVDFRLNASGYNITVHKKKEKKYIYLHLQFPVIMQGKKWKIHKAKHAMTDSRMFSICIYALYICHRYFLKNARNGNYY